MTDRSDELWRPQYNLDLRAVDKLVLVGPIAVLVALSLYAALVSPAMLALTLPLAPVHAWIAFFKVAWSVELEGDSIRWSGPTFTGTASLRQVVKITRLWSLRGRWHRLVIEDRRSPWTGGYGAFYDWVATVEHRARRSLLEE